MEYDKANEAYTKQITNTHFLFPIFLWLSLVLLAKWNLWAFQVNNDVVICERRIYYSAMERTQNGDFSEREQTAYAFYGRWNNISHFQKPPLITVWNNC